MLGGGLSGIEEAGNSSLTSASGGLSGIEEGGTTVVLPVLGNATN